jgi:hypothetical protein
MAIGTAGGAELLIAGEDSTSDPSRVSAEEARSITVAESGRAFVPAARGGA